MSSTPPASPRSRPNSRGARARFAPGKAHPRSPEQRCQRAPQAEFQPVCLQEAQPTPPFPKREAKSPGRQEARSRGRTGSARKQLSPHEKEQLQADLEKHVQAVEWRHKEILKLDTERKKLQQLYRREGRLRELPKKDQGMEKKMAMLQDEADATLKDIHRIRQDLARGQSPEQPQRSLVVQEHTPVVSQEQMSQMLQQIADLQRVLERVERGAQRDRSQKEQLLQENERLRDRVDQLCVDVQGLKGGQWAHTPPTDVELALAASGGTSSRLSSSRAVAAQEPDAQDMLSEMTMTPVEVESVEADRKPAWGWSTMGASPVAQGPQPSERRRAARQAPADGAGGPPPPRAHAPRPEAHRGCAVQPLRGPRPQFPLAVAMPAHLSRRAGPSLQRSASARAVPVTLASVVD